MRSALFNLLVIALIGLAQSPCWALEHDNDDPPSIIVQGEGKVKVKPSAASVRIGVVTEASTAAQALKQNSNSMSELIKTLTEQGIAEKDIQTVELSVSPTYTSQSNRSPRISGYNVRNGVLVRTKAIAQLGPILDAVTASGANNIDGITFTVDNQSKLLDDARKQAMDDASRKATLYAQAGGVQLGKVLHIIEGGLHGGPIPIPMMAATRFAAAAATTPVMSGEQELGVNVTVVYAIP